MLNSDPDGRLQSLGEDHRGASAALASMGVYAFRTEALVRGLRQEAPRDIYRHLLSSMLARGDHLITFPFEGYWADMETVAAYWRASMELLREDAPLGLLDPEWPIRTRGARRPPASLRPGASVSSSLISDGCTIEGRVEGSVLSPGVHIMRGAVVRDSVVLDDANIGPQATVERAILDKNVVVGERVHIGVRGLRASDARFALRAGNGIAVIGKNTHLPDGYRVTRGEMIGCDLDVECFEAPQVTGVRRNESRAPVQGHAAWVQANR
jgi:glucose-1-phosphate adenylyltransferase